MCGSDVCVIENDNIGENFVFYIERKELTVYSGFGGIARSLSGLCKHHFITKPLSPKDKACADGFCVM